MKKCLFKTLSLAFFCSATLLAQRDLGTLTGTVTDTSGAVVAGAKILITEQATGVKETVEADSTGTYVRPLLKPGTYTIEVEATGFRKAIQRDVLLNGGDRVGVNIQLTVGELSQSVEITAAAPLLQTETTTLGNTMNSKVVSELPLGGQESSRSWLRSRLESFRPSRARAMRQAAGSPRMVSARTVRITFS